MPTYVRVDENNIIREIWRSDSRPIPEAVIAPDEAEAGDTWDGKALNKVVQPALYAHVTLSGGDGEQVPGILNDGVDSFNARIEVRDPAGNIAQALTGPWRITIRDVAGAVRDVVRLHFVDGIVEVAYRTTMAPGHFVIREADFHDVQVAPGVRWPVKLVGTAEFKVFRELA